MWVDSRQLAESFGKRHHAVLSAIDLVLRQCPGASPHFRFDRHAVTAGLGGARMVRHAYIDRLGFMLLAMAFPTSQRELALRWALEFEMLSRAEASA